MRKRNSSRDRERKTWEECERKRIKGMRKRKADKEGEKKKGMNSPFGKMITWLYFWFNKQRDVVNNKDTWDMEEKQRNLVSESKWLFFKWSNKEKLIFLCSTSIIK